MTALLVGAGLLYLAALFVLVLLSPSVAFAQDDAEEDALFRALGYGTYVSLGGDAVSTELVLASGGSELNMFQEHRGARVAAHVAYPILVNWATASLYRDGRKKTALWIRVAAVVAFGYATAHNLREAR